VGGHIPGSIDTRVGERKWDNGRDSDRDRKLYEILETVILEAHDTAMTRDGHERSAIPSGIVTGLKRNDWHPSSVETNRQGPEAHGNT